MRVLLVTPHFAPAWIEGGGTVSSWNLARALALAGARVDVVTTDAFVPRAAAPARLRQEAGLSIRTVPVLPGLGRAGQRYGLAPGLARVVWPAALGADVGLVQGLWTPAAPLAAAICRVRGLPYVLCARGTLERTSLGEKALKKRVFLRLYARRVIRGAAAVHFSSERERTESRDALRGTPALVCPHGFDAVAPRPRDGARLRGRLDLPHDALLLGVAGRIHARKGLDVLLPALAGCTVPVHVVAFGPDLEGHLREVRELARRTGVAARFHWLGYLEGDELQSAYAAVDLLALPSYGESFGNVVVEALRQGTEVLVSDAVALAGWVAEHRLGRVVRGHDPRAWTRALERWAGERERFDRARAMRLVHESFDLAACGARMRAALEPLCRLRPAAR
jgi:glycosyltransferase involved in cell wall biosynthesis